MNEYFDLYYYMRLNISYKEKIINKIRTSDDLILEIEKRKYSNEKQNLIEGQIKYILEKIINTYVEKNE